ncbi:ATP-binding protein [Aliikangiella maris]|uniref:ATP-binding protein n=2 Tax=Aliikangiella maris TaxID=3162458 RepID=A0ABV3MNU4_9GAMM
MSPTLNLSSIYSNQENLSILNRVRLIAISGQLSLIFFSSWYFDIILPLNWLLSIVGGEVFFQWFSYQKLKNRAQISDNLLTAILLLDSMILASLIYYSGGANNPFIYLLLLYVALGAFMLTPRNLIIVVLANMVFYSLLNLYQRPLELGDSSPLASFHIHLAGMWVNFLLTVILIAFFGLLSRRVLVQQEKKMQMFREKQLKDEQILSLGIMSASAAHELGTPLSTMAIIVDDLIYQNLQKDIHDDMTLLASQIGNCRQIIQSLSDRSRDLRQQLGKQQENNIYNNKMNLVTQFELMTERWLVYRPQIKLKCEWHPSLPNISYWLSISVEQALTNLLNNAADASLANQQDLVEMRVKTEKSALMIEITDFGEGFSDDIKESINHNIQETNKQDGLGWGLFLTNASIERVGGNVKILQSAEGGTITQVYLPIKEFS